MSSEQRPTSSSPAGTAVPPAVVARPGGLRWLETVGLLLLLDLALGWFLSVHGFGASVPGVPSVAHGAVAAVLSPGFLVPAALELVVLMGVLGTAQHRLFLALGSAQAALVLLVPGGLLPRSWGIPTLALAAVALTAMFVTTLQYMYRHKQLAPTVSGYLLWWSFAALVTAASWAVWAIDGNGLLLAPAVLFQAGLGMAVALRGLPADSEERIPWLLRPFWTFEMLLFTFLAEFFLGALLDYAIAGPGFLQYIPFLPETGSGLAVTGLVLYDGLWFAAAILASAWFLVLVGITMGSLVLFRLKETHEPAQRYRMGLTVAVFALAAIYVPSFASSTPITSNGFLATIPVVGWGFGLRAGGPFESGVFLAVLIMYCSVGVLTVLFGRKAICSVMCGAALLYQAGTVHEMRRFNQTSRIGKYFLGSQLSTAYTVASGLALFTLFGVSLLSVLHMLPAVQVASGKFDTAALPLPVELYFGGLWFVMFVATPYLGTYNCATTGFCHWGALSLPFARVGFFRLKVKDRTVCQQCTTFDCAKACPVGLVDMPEHFRTKGEYRSAKCCGVGDCVGACPYGNMYHQDVRFWIRRKLSPAPPPPRGSQLPMFPVKAVEPPAPVASQVLRN